MDNLPLSLTFQTQFWISVYQRVDPSCDPVGLLSIFICKFDFSFSLPKYITPCRVCSACVVLVRIYTSISLLNGCLAAPPLLVASSTQLLPCALIIMQTYIF